jgi:hypothetical protein
MTRLRPEPIKAHGFCKIIFTSNDVPRKLAHTIMIVGFTFRRKVARAWVG